MPEVLFEDQYTKIVMHREKKYIEYDWKKYVPADEFKNLLNKVVDLCVQHKIVRLLPNMQNMKVIPPEVQKWIETDWMPRTVMSNVKTFAMVNPDSAIAKGSMNNIAVQPDQYGMLVSYFGSLDDARKWIESL